MSADSLILVVNPGSSSRKYALYKNGAMSAVVNFEFEDGKVTGKVEYAGQKYPAIYDDADLSEVSSYVLPLLHQYNVIGQSENITAIGVRVVAPAMRFTKDELLTDEVILALEAIQRKAPLHITTVLAEIKQIKNHFPGVPLVAISDTAFHVTKNNCAWYYGIDPELAEKSGIKRYGYHGISMGSIVHYLQEQNALAPKTIICHLGSGSSLTAVLDGKSYETTMGYSPLEGLMMATRCGNMDISAALAIKHELGFSDEELEQYLNKKCGLIGVSGSSNDIRQLITSEEAGDSRAKLALDLLVYRIQLLIGQMAASMNGVDEIIFTGTVGERSNIIRGRILEKLTYLGFTRDKEADEATFEPKQPALITLASGKKAFVVSTDESSEIARRTEEFVKQS
jgi:acetate kinase